MAISLTSSSTTGAVKVNGQDVITTDASGNVSLRNEGTLLTASQVSGLQAIGIGQTWQDVTASRASGVTYTNTTGKPIFVIFSGGTSTATTLTITTVVNGVTISLIAYAANTARGYSSFIVPVGGTYSVTVNTNGINIWAELR
jgi:hypothetical protein